MANKYWNRAVLPLFALFLSAGAGAQDVEKVMALIRDGKLRQARDEARAGAESSDARVLHVLGVLEIANGRPAQAAAAFGRIIDLEGQVPPAETGLEEHYRPGFPLYRALTRQKALLSMSTGEAAAHNNRGAAYVLLAKPDEAFEDLDLAAVMASDWGAPWTNGSLAWMLKHNASKAAESARKGIDLGERSTQAFTTLAEAEIALSQNDRAREDLERAIERDPEYPYALLAKAKLATREGRERDAHRALTQALSSGSYVAVDSNFAQPSGEGSGLTGDSEDNHLALNHRGLSGDALGYRFDYQNTLLRIEDRERARQRGEQIEGAVGGGALGTLYLKHTKSSGGRPGLEEGQLGIPMFPNARFDYENTFAAWQKTVPMHGGSELLLHAALRNSRVESKLTTSGATVVPLRDRQHWLEARWDQRRGGNSGLSLGLASSSVKRTGVGGTPIEPVEQVFSVGTTEMLTAYGLITNQLTPNMRLTYGAIYGEVEGTRLMQPAALLSVRLTDARSVHFAIRPRFNESGTNLIPLAVLGETPQRNTLDRREFTPQAQNFDPTFVEPEGRITAYEIILAHQASERRRMDTVLFYKTLNDFRTQGSDPRLAPDMILTSHDKGWALGLEERFRLALSEAFTLRAHATFQISRADYVLQTFKAESYPVQEPTGRRDLPNFPRWQAGLSLDWAHRGTDLSLEVQYLGRRQSAVTVAETLGSVVYIWDLDPSTSVNVHFRHRIGSHASLRASVFNLARDSFYPGYGSSVTSIAGFEYRF